MKKLMTTAMAAALLAGCTADDPTYSSFFSEAGSEIDSGDFGNATMNNMLVQTGQQDYTINLARRFASDVNSTVNFAFNSTVLDADARATLIKQADWIRQFPEVRFRVYGHTDLVGSNAYNRRLGLRRAQAVVGFLTSQGIDRSRLEALASFGETRPVVATQNRERRNRRTVTEVSGFVESNPLILNGKYAEVIFREYVRSATPQSGRRQTVISTGG
ncbi:OmpA family protein [Yoonia sediminilitoris]|uniref:Outer membrane protein OmpA-like peptidoglycan-associated protein n=1 Tax=Yoonia sediminilitoris TaxID=1286148 RepID=A0A2T6KK31_9RHOB|nr:OmpA family protein [Yoonia sediminilitoris]PUB16318.1 outer membrane protein OmpA-like peptidoglycan-associated protein [Yoonia sediminilitoris]RCW96667.1 outer membrane protein OmpA-like peptidoglycan-associated protein [Yoonia sediminilitoris]